jgi:hypothetical protein
VHVVVGENFRFGHGAEGDAATLTALGQRLGFGVTSVALVTADGERVSSSWIRELVRQGEERAHLPGRAPQLDGTVGAGSRPRARRAGPANRADPAAASSRRSASTRASARPGESAIRLRSRWEATPRSATSRAPSWSLSIGFEGDATTARAHRVQPLPTARARVRDGREPAEQMWRDIEAHARWPRASRRSRPDRQEPVTHGEQQKAVSRNFTHSHLPAIVALG